MRALGKRLGFIACTGILLFSVSSNLGAAEPNDHAIVFKPGQTSAHASGEFSKAVQEVYFSFDANAGQHLFVRITPITPKLITAGVVIYPSGKQDGGPGGIVFNSDLTESGRYRLRVSQRQSRVEGKFRVLVRISQSIKKEDLGSTPFSEWMTFWRETGPQGLSMAGR